MPPETFVNIVPNQLMELYWTKGMTQKEIAKMYCCRPQTISKKMRKFSIKVRNRFPDITPNLLERLYRVRGMTQGEIARIYGCKLGTVYTKMKKFGIRTRNPSERRKGERNPNYINIAPNQLKELYWTRGLTQAEIAKECNCDKQTVYKKMKEFEIGARSHSERQMGERGPFYGKHHSEKTRRRISQVKSGTQKGKDNPFYGRRHSLETIRRIMRSKDVKPNKAEKLLTSLIKENKLPYKYTGNGEVIIGGRNPDFLNVNGEKKVIELFGRGWHKPGYGPFNVRENVTEPKTIDHYKGYGFDCLVIWDNELKNSSAVVDRIKGWG